MSDADTIANAPILWEIVELIQAVITPGGQLKIEVIENDTLFKLRKLADEARPEN